MPEKVKDTIQEVIDSSIPASCTIYCKTRKQQWSGSGFHIGNGYVCTASHVCTPDLINEGEVSITFDQEIFFNVAVLKSDPNVDSAILSIKGDYGNIPSVMLANSDSVSVHSSKSKQPATTVIV